MLYPAAAIANELIDRADSSQKQMTQINIQKLVYFAHGWHLGLKGEPLVAEPIEAWKYGPVVSNLYSQFRRFGSGPITDKASFFEMDSRMRIVTTVPSIESNKPEDDQYARSLVGAIWQKYGHLAPFRLVELTHAAGSPWDDAWKADQKIIPNDKIRAYFAGLTKHAQ